MNNAAISIKELQTMQPLSFGARACLVLVVTTFLWTGPAQAQEVNDPNEPEGQQPASSTLKHGEFEGRRGNDLPLLSNPAKDFFDAGAKLQAAEAIAKRDNHKLGELISQIPDINRPGRDGVTLLYWAYLQGNLDAFKYLLERGGSPDVAPSAELPIEPGLLASRTNGIPLLAHACQERIMRPGFFEAGFGYTKQPNQRSDTGNTFLHGWVSEPASAEQRRLLDEIVAAGVDLNARNALGYTALQRAVPYNPQAMLVLLDAGANPHLPLPDGKKLIDLVREYQSLGDKAGIYQRVIQRLDPPALSQAFTRSVLERLELSDAQRAELEKLQSDVDQRLAEILSADQLQKLRKASP